MRKMVLLIAAVAMIVSMATAMPAMADRPLTTQEISFLATVPATGGLQSAVAQLLSAGICHVTSDGQYLKDTSNHYWLGIQLKDYVDKRILEIGQIVGPEGPAGPQGPQGPPGPPEPIQYVPAPAPVYSVPGILTAPPAMPFVVTQTPSGPSFLESLVLGALNPLGYVLGQRARRPTVITITGGNATGGAGGAGGSGYGYGAAAAASSSSSASTAPDAAASAGNGSSAGASPN